MIDVWDTDTFSWWERRRGAFDSRLASLRPGDAVAVSAITAYEALRGRVAIVAQARDERDRVAALTALARTFAALAARPTLPYTTEAAARFAALRSGRGNRGAYDLRLAAIALSAGAVLVTRNAAHYADIEGLTVENWID